MGQLVAGGWTAEQSDALTTLVMTGGKSYAQAAVIINEQFGTNFSRNSAIGRANRLKLKSPFKQERKPQAERVRKPREVKERTKVIEGGFGSRRIIRQTFTVEQVQLRCVEIVPRNIPLIDLEPNDCRYPYGDGPMLFCGHPKMEGESYCVPHFHLCREEPRKPRQPHFVRAA